MSLLVIRLMMIIAGIFFLVTHAGWNLKSPNFQKGHMTLVTSIMIV